MRCAGRAAFLLLLFPSCMILLLTGCGRDGGTKPPPPAFGWSTFGSGFLQPVRALAPFRGSLIAGGSFFQAGDSTVNGIARWDGTTWRPMAAGFGGSDSGDLCCALAVHDDRLIAGGDFLTAGGSPAANIAQWDGIEWVPLGSGTDGPVRVLVAFGNEIVAGGSFAMAGDVEAQGIASWDGSAWSPIYAAMPGAMHPQVIRAATSYHGDLIAAGDFRIENTVASNRVARWNGANWQFLGEDMDDPVLALAVWNDRIVAGGWFAHAGGADARGIAQWDGAAWQSIGSGVSVGLEGHPAVGVICLLPFGTDLMAGGSFSKAGGNWANCIARWDGSSWNAIGGTDLDVITLAAWDDALILGGGFTWAGGITAHRIARWGI